MKECVSHGISKVNVNKLVLDDYLDHVNSQSHLPLTRLMEEGVEKVMARIEWQMDVCGSTGQCER